VAGSTRQGEATAKYQATNRPLWPWGEKGIAGNAGKPWQTPAGNAGKPWQTLCPRIIWGVSLIEWAHERWPVDDGGDETAEQFPSCTVHGFQVQFRGETHERCLVKTVETEPWKGVRPPAAPGRGGVTPPSSPPPSGAGGPAAAACRSRNSRSYRLRTPDDNTEDVVSTQRCCRRKTPTAGTLRVRAKCRVRCGPRLQSADCCTWVVYGLSVEPRCSTQAVM